MESDTITSQDQISLYGLFGDSSSTLHGLDEHLSPSILRQSPPRGSTYSMHQAMTSSVTFSPVKLESSSGSQLPGLMLSDLADRSPSAGSIAASTICTFVSFDNLRCTNRVFTNGKRLCGQHTGQESKKVRPTVEMKVSELQAVDRVSVSKPSLVSPMLYSAAVYSPSMSISRLQSIAGKPVRTVKVEVKSLASSMINKNGIDVVDGTKSFPIKREDSSASWTLPKSQLAQRVGQTITVTTRVPTSKAVVNGLSSKSIKQSSLQSPTCMSTGCSSGSPGIANKLRVQQSTIVNTPSNGIPNVKCSAAVQQPRKTVRLSVMKPSSLSSDASRKVQHPALPSLKVESGRSGFKACDRGVLTQSAVSGSQKIKPVLSTAGSQTHPVTIASKVQPLQSLMIDEKTLKTLLDVLNSQSDMTSQQQIGLLRSLGITVVQGPVNHLNLNSIKKHPISKPAVRKKSSPGYKQKQYAKSNVGGNFDAQGIVKGHLPTVSRADEENEQPFSNEIYKASSTHQHSVLIDDQSLHGNNSTSVHQVVGNKNVLFSATGKSSVKRKKKLSTIPAKKKCCEGGANQMDGNAALTSSSRKQKIKPKASKNKMTKYCTSKNDAKQIQPDLLVGELLIPPRPYPKLLRTPSQSGALYKFAERHNEELLMNHDLFDLAPSELDLNSDPGANGEDLNRLKKLRLLKKHASRKRTKHKVIDHDECVQNLKRIKFHDRYVAASDVLHSLQFPLSSKSVRNLRHHEEMLQEFSQKTADQELSAKNMKEPLNFGDSNDWLLDASISTTEETMKQLRLIFTLRRRRHKHMIKQLAKTLQKDEEDIDLLLESYNSDPWLTTHLLNSSIASDDRSKSRSRILHQKRCILSNNSGPGCSAPALPYALYCKHHIWHCQRQCLYTLNKNMKPAADIDPEPFVKKVRKRTKLLPLIKRYKKKKRRKILSGGHDVESTDNGDELVNKDESVGNVLGHTLVIGKHENESEHKNRTLIADNVEFVTYQGKGKEADLEAKSSEVGEEDLHLTGQEIMMSGVFDKLPEDLNDFDLFTTDRGAEELERALQLAASSPTPEHDGSDESTMKQFVANPDVLLGSSTSQKTKPKNTSGQKEGSPSSNSNLIVLDAPLVSNTSESPPSIESFKQSQCVHYTFGSNCVSTSKKQKTRSEENDEESCNSEEDLSTAIISAEDLQDIEGLLESLQKDEEDVHSPMLPSSPAVDQYTSMLAEQLSQEVESESLLRRSSSNHLLKVTRSSSTVPRSVCPLTVGNRVKAPSSVVRSFSLPVVNHSNNRNGVRSKSTVPVSTSIPLKSPISVSSKAGTNISKSGYLSTSRSLELKTVLSTSSYLDPLGLDVILPSLHDKSHIVQSQGPNVSSKTTENANVRQVSGTLTTSSIYECFSKQRHNGIASSLQSENARKLAKKNHRKLTLTNVPPSSGSSITPNRGIQGKASQPSTVLASNQILPLTLMQTPGQVNNTSIIKVIVPPGTVMNGSGSSSSSHQNMILIPVNAALVRSNMIAQSNQSSPVTVPTASATTSSTKTQLSSLHAGQQFLIVNNSTATTQSHLTLVQKPTSVPTTHQALVLNSASTHKTFLTPNQQPSSTTVQKPAGQKISKQVLYNIKPNMNVYLNPTISKFLGARAEKLAPQTLSATSKAKAKSINVSAKSNFTSYPVTMTTSTLNTKLRNSTFGKFPVQPIGGQKVKVQAKKPTKARFDPVTKKYVSSDAMLHEKFNASALSTIQNKVQQINSVLSSLNSAKMTSSMFNPGKQTFVNGPTDKRNISKNNRLVKSITLPVTNLPTPTLAVTTTPNQMSITAIPNIISSSKSACITVSMPTNAKTIPADSSKNSITISLTGQTVEEKNGKAVFGSQKTSNSTLNVQRDLPTKKTDPPATNLCSTTESSIMKSAKSVVESDSKLKSASSTSSGGTVHWNQTTTAGPEITPNITVPLYITGAIPSAWASELGVNVSNIPILFPAHKISPNYQLPQRVILGNIGSLGVVSSKGETKDQTNTVTISTRPWSAKAKLVSEISNVNPHQVSFSTMVSSKVANSSNPVSAQTGTCVTAVMGTTMSPKLSPYIAKSSGGYVVFDHQDDVHVSNAEDRDASTNPRSTPNSSVVANINIKQIASSGARTVKKVNGIMIPTYDATSAMTKDVSLSKNIEATGTNRRECDVVGKSQISDVKTFKRKCGRKASHDTILYDPLMYDPTTLDIAYSDDSD